MLQLIMEAIVYNKFLRTGQLWKRLVMRRDHSTTRYYYFKFVVEEIVVQ